METIKIPVKYDKPLEVNKDQYKAAMDLSMVCAGMEKNGKYFVKLWGVSAKKHVIKALNKHQSDSNKNVIYV